MNTCAETLTVIQIHTRLQGAYFLGKVLWAKGYTELLERLQEHGQATGNAVQVDVYGAGPDLPVSTCLFMCCITGALHYWYYYWYYYH